MQAFAQLVDSLTYTRSRLAKIRLIADYIKMTPDPDRGWAIAALTGDLSLPAIKSSAVRRMIEARVDPVLFRLSRDYVGDTAETIGLLWPGDSPACDEGPKLSAVIDLLAATKRSDGPDALSRLLDITPSNQRYALIKLATGALRVGISGRLTRTALAEALTLNADDLEEMWHGLKPPYTELFEWAAGNAEKPAAGNAPAFRPFMLAYPLDDIESINLTDYSVEWKWDGIRVQVVRSGGETRLFSRGGDDVTAAFPEISGALELDAAFDGELLVRGDAQGGHDGGAANFNALQQRLGRKRVSAAMLEQYPAFVRLYDILSLEGTDVRNKPWTARRMELEEIAKRLDRRHFDLSTVLDVSRVDELVALRAGARDAAIEGLMLKRRDSAYSGGRHVGSWYKWKREPLVADCVLMYAQRGSGKRSSFYSDYTFGCWTKEPSAGGELVPVGKAYSGFSDAELKWIDKFVRSHSIARFGPVREVEKSLVFEVAFDSVHHSKRHKSGVAMRFPRISRLRRDKPADEADMLPTLLAMIDG